MESLRLIPHTDPSQSLPNNVEAEAALLGALMISNSLVGTAAACVTAEDFYEGCHGEIYSLILREVEAGRLATPVTLRPAMEQFAWAKELGGAGYLAKLTGNGAALLGVKDFALQVSQLAKRRRVMAALQNGIDLMGNLLEGYDEIENVVAAIDASLNAAVQADPSSTTRTFARAWDDAVISHDAIAAGSAEPGWYIKGLPDFNQLTGGLRTGNLLVLAGRPGMGKTAVAGAIALGAAEAGIGTDFFSLEMEEAELMERWITGVCYDYDDNTFTYDQFQKGKLSPRERQRVNAWRDRIAEWPMAIHRPASTKVGSIIMDMRRRKRAAQSKGRDIQLFIIDYLQLMQGDKSRDNETREIGEITRALKLAAGEMGVCIILLSQLNREVEKREDKRPHLSDLRASGSIEQDADIVIFLYREEYYLQMSEPRQGDKKRIEWEESLGAARDKLDLIAAKVRKGRTRTRTCYFFAEHMAVRGSKYLSESRES